MAETVSKKAYETAYKRLNPAQKKAVDSIEGPVMVVAGPGTGKTQILTLRIATILKETQANPEDILALTFTNSGVRAMRDRLRTYIGDAAYRVNIFTFHSFAEYILKQYSSYFPGHEYSEVITALEKSQILEEILEAYDFSKIVSTYDRFSSLRQVMDAIDSIKQEGLSPEEFEASIPQWEQAQLADENMFYRVSRGAFKKGDIKPAELKKVEQRVAKAREISTAYRAYQAALQKRQRYDFSDMILTVLRGLEESSELVLDLAERYQYLLIDEHQDTNEGQNKLIELITAADHLEGHPNLFTVGDEKQSIYRFQGASEETFDHFRSFYKDVSVIDLTENYRSTAPILEAAHSVIINSLPTAIALNSNQPEDKVVQVREFSDYKFELLWLANDIRQCLDAGVPPEEIAIIYRSNKHLGEIKPLLEQYSIPYLVRAKDTVLDDPRISLFLSLFSVIANPNDDHSLGKLLFADFLGLDPIMVTSTLREYRSAARAGQAASLLDFLRSTKGYEELVSLVGELVTYDANHHFTDTFKEVLERSGFLKQSLTLSDSRNALRKIEVLMNEMRTHAEREKAYQAKDFVAFLSATEAYRLTIEATATTVGGGVQCLTAHSSKGLEFEYVYVVNTTSKNWEKSRGFSPITLPLKQYQGDLHDERRLFYVAMTRAKTRLLISSAASDWQGKDLEPSQFVEELASSAVERVPTHEFEQANESELTRFLEQTNIKASLFDVDYLWGRFLDENLSVTALNNYLECPAKYLFRNLIHLPDVFTPALRYGDAMHRALEQYFKLSQKEEVLRSRAVLLSCFESAMKTAGFYGDEFDRFLQKGRQSLGMYYDYYHKDWILNVALEEYVRCVLQTPAAEITISGKIDKIEYLKEGGAGPVRIVDYKTGKPYSKKTTKAQKQDLERQIQFYYLLLKDWKEGTVTVMDAILDFVEPSDENEFEQKTFTVTKEDLGELTNEISTMVEAIKNGTFLSGGCQKKDCEYCSLLSAVTTSR